MTAREYLAAIERTIPPDPATIPPAPRPRSSKTVEKPEVEEVLVGGAGPATRAAPSLRIALWSDGVLHIQRPGGHAVQFSRDETQQLVGYLKAISLDSVREEA